MISVLWTAEWKELYALEFIYSFCGAIGSGLFINHFDVGPKFAGIEVFVVTTLTYAGAWLTNYTIDYTNAREKVKLINYKQLLMVLNIFFFCCSGHWATR